MRALLLAVCGLVLIGVTGCGGDDPVELAIASPAPGTPFTRDHLGTLGALDAAIPIQLVIDGMPARVAIAIAGVDQAAPGADGAAIVFAPTAGAVTIVATAYDDAGAALASATVEVVVVEPTVADCHGWLDLYGVGFTAGPASQGVADPITAMMPINGIAYRTGSGPRTKMFGDCTLIRSLAIAAPFLRARDLVEVTDLGVYNYRCINNNGTPPNCPDGISEHSYGTAIDLAVFHAADATTYSVNDDWVIDPAADKTCEAATEPGKDELLHALICELKAADVWNIVLTPNYNAAHRNHFHVDLTDGSDFMRRTHVIDADVGAHDHDHAAAR